MKKIQNVEGLKLISDDEMEQFEIKDCLGSEFTQDEDKLRMIRNKESKLSLRTINSIKSKNCSKLSKNQMAAAFDDLEVSSQSSGEISIAASSNASIF